jgi:hypothetical protein
MKVSSCGSANPVNVTYVENGSNKGWNLQHCKGSGGPGHYPVLKAPFDETPTFTFSITNAPGVTFDATAPVWVTVGTNKPTQLDPGLISPVQGAGTRTISFADLNNYNGGDAVTLTYMLRFSNNTATDPIIQNGGCCRSGYSAFLPTTNEMFAIELGLAFLAGVVITLIVRRFRRG